MPTYSLLGISVWIPSFSDLTAAVTSGLSTYIGDILNRIGNAIAPWIQPIAQAAYTLLAPLVNLAVSGLQRVGELVRPIIDAVGQRILSFLLGIGTQVANILRPVIESVWARISPYVTPLLNILQGLAERILSGIRPWIDAIKAALHGDFAPLISQALTGLRGTLDILARGFPGLQLAVGAVQVGLDALNARVQGQPVELEKIFSAKINEVLNPLARLGKDVWEGFNTYIKPVLDAAVSALQESIGAFLQPLIEAFYKLPLAKMEIWPTGAFARATGSMMLGMVAFNALYVALTSLELIHPLKQVGLLRIIDATRALLGADTLGRLIAGGLFSPLYGVPLRYEMNALFRPHIPVPRQADQMLFEENISQQDWHDVYAWWGWKEKYIQAWYKTMFVEPSDRLIISMVEGGAVPMDWLERKAKERGYSPEDRQIVLGYATRKALADEIKANISELQSDIQVGIVDLLEARSELQDVGVTGPELEFRMRALDRRIKRLDIKAKIDLLTSQVKEGELTIPQYRMELIALGLRIPRVNALVEKEELRQKPRVDKPKERKRDLAMSFYVRLYVEGTLSLEKLTRYLSELDPPLTKDRLELVITDAKLRRMKAMAEAARAAGA